MIGSYRCEVNDQVGVSENPWSITITRSNSKSNSNTKHVDINAVMKGETPFDFLLKCISMSNQNAAVHFLNHSTHSLTKQSQENLLKEARLKGTYCIFEALEKQGAGAGPDPESVNKKTFQRKLFKLFKWK